MDRQAAPPNDHPLGRVQEFLKQIVFGGTDGIITTFAVVAGFAGAQVQGVAQIGGLAVLLFGLANLFADGVSMGLGEFLSLRAQQDLYRTRRGTELRTFAEHPAGQTERLSRMLARKGLAPTEAETAAAIFSHHPQIMTELLLAEEIGLRPPEGESPVLNGIVTTGAFMLFGTVPLLPYLLFDATAETTRLSLVSTLLALLLLGLLRWHAIGERLWRSVGETVLVGTVCATVAFAVGQLVGG